MRFFFASILLLLPLAANADNSGSGMLGSAYVEDLEQPRQEAFLTGLAMKCQLRSDPWKKAAFQLSADQAYFIAKALWPDGNYDLSPMAKTAFDVALGIFETDLQRGEEADTAACKVARESNEIAPIDDFLADRDLDYHAQGLSSDELISSYDFFIRPIRQESFLTGVAMRCALRPKKWVITAAMIEYEQIFLLAAYFWPGNDSALSKEGNDHFKKISDLIDSDSSRGLKSQMLCESLGSGNMLNYLDDLVLAYKESVPDPK